ncbi:exonuclease domain-containing protein [Pseudoalteromonas fenneropenaei]|uniref:DNA-directed DNA polymerase n=1 Tax=Pseudoalteromonas fenneropenaei TaxID=1737459 RepID=A0ABV7CK08_9GAMM
MAPVILPEKYYLQHFREMQCYITQTSLHLLDSEQRRHFDALDTLTEDALCLLLRLLGRKHVVFACDSLHYQEISDISAALDLLQQQQWIRPLSHDDVTLLLAALNKAELQQLVTEFALAGPAKSAKKPIWQDYIAEHLPHQQLLASPLARNHIVVNSQRHFDYWQYLYFGNSHGQLNQFSLRDMGILATRKHTPAEPSAHFEDIAEAQFGFKLMEWQQACKALADEALSNLAATVLAEQPLLPLDSDALKERYHHLLFRLYSKLLESDAEQAHKCLLASEHPKALEKQVRLLFQQGNIEACQSLLDEILTAPPSEELLLFAEDFSQRKFTRKRTSILTDILRASSQPLAIDEAYVQHVEAGVCERYQRQGKIAFHVENQLWLTLFGLVFWPELYLHKHSGVHNAFQRLPNVLKRGRFYQQLGDEITIRLNALYDSRQLILHLQHIATEHYGEPNGLFTWHPGMLEPLLLFINHSDLASVKAHLLAMCKDFKALKDGYPDLLIVDDGKVRFEEIKAPGDMLRRNQLVSITALQKAGFAVAVQTTRWHIDPEQPYLVVDLETTGGNAQNDRITEVAIVTLVAGKIVDSWSTLVNPERHIPRFITELTGISDEMVRTAPTFAEVMDTIEGKLAAGIFVAHNVNFDYGFLKHSFARFSRPFQRPKLCTVQLARKHLPGHSSYSLGKLCQALDIELIDHHRALADATATAHLMQLINEKRMSPHD